MLGIARQPSASPLPRTLALVAICAGLFALPAQAGAANPVAHALDVLDTTAARQLAPVAKAVADVPLPAPVAADSTASDAAAQTADAPPQAAAATTTVIHSSAGDAAERERPGEAAQGTSHSTHDEAPRSPAERNLPAPIASTAPLQSANAAPLLASAHAGTPVRPAPIVAAARAIVPADAKRVTSTLAHATASLPTARDLNARASQIAGALIEAVGGLAQSAQRALAALPAITVPAIPQTLAAAKATLTPTTEITTANLPRSTQLAAASIAVTGAAKSTAPVLAMRSTHPSTALGSEMTRNVAHARAMPRGAMPPGPSSDTRASAGLRVAAVAGSAPGEPRAKPLTSSAASPSVPSPSPGGVSPSSGAAIGGSSLATFLAVLALLLLAGPRSLRRMRLAAVSLRATQFALIPERPG